MAGVVPGFMIGFGLMIYCYFFGPPGTRRDRASFGVVARATRDAALPLMIPVILLGGILTGWFTPTEAGVVAVSWILLVVIPMLNPKHVRKLPYDFCFAGLIYSLPLITIAAATAFGWMLAYLRGAIVISDVITGLAGNDPHLIMLLLVLLFTIVGDFIEPVPTIIIFMPLVNALTEAGSINPVHMGVVLIATLAFGLIPPPYGLVLLMASKFVGVRFSHALRAACPIYAVFLFTIAFTIYFPSVVLWLPKQVLPASVGCFPNPNGPGYICPPYLFCISRLQPGHAVAIEPVSGLILRNSGIFQIASRLVEALDRSMRPSFYSPVSGGEPSPPLLGSVATLASILLTPDFFAASAVL